jgi:hypothetical protein
MRPSEQENEFDNRLDGCQKMVEAPFTIPKGDINKHTTDLSPYHSVVLHSIPKLLTNLDRDPDSPTFGCFDRNYWHYKVHDYSSAILQQSALTLALVYLHDFRGNLYFKNELIRSYAIAGLTFCIKFQHRDGSFDEYWKHEHSIPSTAFTLYAICETSDILEYNDNNLHECIRKSVQFLKKNREPSASNQEMVSIAAIMYSAKILEDNTIRKEAENRFKTFLTRQTKEGWFPEYGGLDISYLTVTLDYLIRYYELCSDDDALASAKKILNMVIFFIHPDGSIGGEYGTRNTQYFLPYGIEFLTKENENAAGMIKSLTGFINQPMYLNTSWDDRYLLHYISHSFVKALIIYKSRNNSSPLPCETTFFRYFEDAQIVIKSTDFYYFIGNLSKGGIFTVIDKKNHTVSTDCGYRLKHHTIRYVTEFPENNAQRIGENEIFVTTKFKKIHIQQPSGIGLFLLRAGSFFLGAQMRVLVKKMILFSKKEMRDMRFTRSIFLENDRIIIDDIIDIRDCHLEGQLCSGSSIRYIPSSKFFQINSLKTEVKNIPVNIDGKLELHREIIFGPL